ncbi:MAG: DEAD/DEAH box helicase, partial [Acholeplasmataceae bacterium]
MIYELNKVKGLGFKTIKKLNQLGIKNTYDLVLTFPKSYLNLDKTKYQDLKHDENITVMGEIISDIVYTKKKVPLVITDILLDSHKIRLIIFNRPYLKNSLKIGDKVLIKGKYNYFKKEIVVNFISSNLNLPTITPVYNLDGIYDYVIINALKYVFENNLVDIYETLPNEVVFKYKLLKRIDTIKNIHFPKDYFILNKVNKRLKHEEAFLHLFKYLSQVDPRNKRKTINYDLDIVKGYIKKIPYELTDEQKNVVNEIYLDFKKDESLYRLIEGDVGTGKTVVSFLAGIGMVTSKYQVAMMAPTEILARQHYENFKNLFPDVKSIFLTSSLKNKSEIIKEISTSKPKFIFGTHVLASDNIVFNNLGLVIIDEQHKFGVEVRNKLINKSVTKDIIYLTATPIPRSLSLTFFGDLDVSIIKEKPIIKEKVETNIINDDINLIIKILNDAQNKNEQSFIVVPAILENENKASITEYEEKLKPIYKNDLYVIHGNLKPEEIDEIMNNYLENHKGILLSTTIIEVGIDVKNATSMIIINADNFGLFQLHQLRGRVGRGE